MIVVVAERLTLELSEDIAADVANEALAGALEEILVAGAEDEPKKVAAGEGGEKPTELAQGARGQDIIHGHSPEKWVKIDERDGEEKKRQGSEERFPARPEVAKNTPGVGGGGIGWRHSGEYAGGRKFATGDCENREDW